MCPSLASRRMMLVLMILCIAITKVIADGLNPISQPAANSVVPVEQPYTIMWSPGTPGPVFIALLTNTDGSNITTSTSNTGIYAWTPDTYFATHNGGRDYFLKICDLNTRDCTYTFNGRFSFSDDSPAATSIPSSSPQPPTSTAVQVITSISYTLATTSYAAGGVPTTTASIGAPQSLLQVSSQTISQISVLSTSQRVSQFASSSDSDAISGVYSKTISTDISPAQKSSQSRSTSNSLIPISSSTINPSTFLPTATTITTSAPNHGSSRSLSTGVKIAIGVVLSVLSTATLILVGLLILRRRRKSPNMMEAYHKPELSADSVERLDGRSTNGQPYWTNSTYELPGDASQVFELGSETTKRR